MEDVKKKKKNRRGKGKATKAVDNATVGPEESLHDEAEVNHASGFQQNHQETETQNTDAPDRGEPTQTVEGASPNSEKTMQAGSGMNLGNPDSIYEQYHQESNVGTAGAENVSVLDSEAEMESRKTIESDLVNLRETVKDVQNSVLLCIEKEATLMKSIELLQNGNELFAKNEISWNLKLEQLQSKMLSFAVNETRLEEKIINMEKENDSRIHNENLIIESIAKLEKANTGLQMQVMELQRSKDNLAQENQQLTSSISLLEAQVQLLENEVACFRSSTRTITEHASEDADSVKEVEPVGELSEKLIAVEPALTEVNQQSGLAEYSATSSAPSTEADANMLPVTYSSPHEEIISGSTDKFAPSGAFFETISIAGAGINGFSDAQIHPKELQLLDDLNGSAAEIVQIPLDDNQVQQVDVDALRIRHEEKAVPLSDAPLIGAPFRFVSFVAKYVSGADLVKENRRNSGR